MLLHPSVDERPAGRCFLAFVCIALVFSGCSRDGAPWGMQEGTRWSAAGRVDVESSIEGESRSFEVEIDYFLLGGAGESGEREGRGERVLGVVRVTDWGHGSIVTNRPAVFMYRTGLEDRRWERVMDPGPPYSAALEWPDLLPFNIPLAVRHEEPVVRREAVYLAQDDSLRWEYRIAELADSSAQFAVRRRPAAAYPIKGDTERFSIEIDRSEIDWAFTGAGDLAEVKIRRDYNVRFGSSTKTIRESAVNRLSFAPPEKLSADERRRLTAQWNALERLTQALPDSLSAAWEHLQAAKAEYENGPLSEGLDHLETVLEIRRTPRTQVQDLWEGLVGEPVPAFALANLGGETVAPQDFQGNVVLLNFFGERCGPCRREIPVLVELHREFSDRGFQVLGINAWNEPRDKLEKMVQEQGIPYPILTLGKDVARRLFHVQGVPFSVWVDRDGRVAGWHSGYRPDDESEYREMLGRLLGGG
ncbi:MAG: redoxin domain-containing protein [Candidatus Eisenbacteria bacterium]|nr:redoxin domain-containing protein [Candidatus Eisenbacteria bacterium]